MNITNGEESQSRYLNALHETAHMPLLDPNKPIRLYVRSANTLFHQAQIYQVENDLEKAFILFLKYSNLVLKELPKHPEYSTNSNMVMPLRSKILPALDFLEAAKPVLLQRFSQAEQERSRLIQREREFSEARRREEEARQLAEKAARQQEEARRLRIQEMQKLDMRRIHSEARDKKETLSIGNIMDDFGQGDRGDCSSTSVSVDGLPTPLLASPAPVISKGTSPLQATLLSPSSPPLSLTGPKLPLAITPSALSSPKAFYYLENGMALRTIVVPASIVDTFLKLAAPNTNKNLETGGLLAGHLAHDTLTITTLIIPKQQSTSDSVTMASDEPEVWELHDRNGLLSLGWIHTHPTQKCFMSSIDLHTHHSLQVLMAEAIAIVVAPTQRPNFGIFRLTDPPGLGIISGCHQRDFHPHPTERGVIIYKDISGAADGHAKFSSELSLQVIDLR